MQGSETRIFSADDSAAALLNSSFRILLNLTSPPLHPAHPTPPTLHNQTLNMFLNESIQRRGMPALFQWQAGKVASRSNVLVGLCGAAWRGMSETTISTLVCLVSWAGIVSCAGAVGFSRFADAMIP